MRLMPEEGAFEEITSSVPVGATVQLLFFQRSGREKSTSQRLTLDYFLLSKKKKKNFLGVRNVSQHTLTSTHLVQQRDYVSQAMSSVMLVLSFYSSHGLQAFLSYISITPCGHPLFPGARTLLGTLLLSTYIPLDLVICGFVPRQQFKSVIFLLHRQQRARQENLNYPHISQNMFLPAAYLSEKVMDFGVQNTLCLSLSSAFYH